MQLPKILVKDKKTAFPVIQGGMAVRISLAPLAAAVARSGGIGIIGASGMPPAELAQHIDRAQKTTKGIIGVNIMVALNMFKELVQVAVEKKVDLIISGAGISRDLFKWTKDKIPVFTLVSSARLALISAELGASGIIVESGEAGGHLGTDPRTSVWDILPETIKILRKNKYSSIPVIAAGGILKGKDIARAVKMGASGVQMGTRFALTHESSAHANWKKILLEAKEEDVEIIKSPVGMRGRAVRTPFVEKILKDEAPPPGTYRLCRVCLGQCNKQYCIIEALEKAQKGNVEEGIFFCGSRVGEINDVLSVSEVFLRLKKEYQAAVQTDYLRAAT